MKKIYLLVALVVGIVANTEAQVNSYLALNWSSSIPFGSLKDYTENTSSSGFEFDLGFEVTSNIMVGMTSGWNYHSQKINRATYVDGTSSLSAVQTRYVSFVPVMAHVKYAPSMEGGFQPYFGLAIGAQSVKYEQWFGRYGFVETKWPFAISPEIGIAIPFTTYYDYSGLNIKVKYNMMPGYEYREISGGLSSLNINVGFILPI